MQDNQSNSLRNSAFVLGIGVGLAAGAYMMSPKARRWMKDRAEWAKTDGAETLEHVKRHAKEGFSAVKNSAGGIKEEVSNLKRGRNNQTVSTMEP